MAEPSFFTRLSVFALAAMLLVPGAAAADPSASTATVAQSASVDPYSDVPQGHWAYDAIGRLAADGYIKGYPDGQYKGARPMTRYEAAVLVAAADNAIRNKLAQGQKVESDDVAALKKLISEYKSEVDDVSARLGRLEKRTDALATQTTALAARATAVKSEADTTADLLNRGRLGFMLMHHVGTIGEDFEGTNGPSTLPVANGGATTVAPFAAIPGGVGSTAAKLNGNVYGFGPGLNNMAPLGTLAHGTDYLFTRIIFGGQFSSRFSWGARLSARTLQESNLETSSQSPAYCTGIPNFTATPTSAATSNCSFADLSNGQASMPVALDYTFVGYTSPGGFFDQLGRYVVGEGNYNINPILFGANSVTGNIFGWRDPHGEWDGALVYGAPYVTGASMAAAQAAGGTGICTAGVIGLNAGNTVRAGLNGLNPYCASAQGQELAGYGSHYWKKSRTALGFVLDSFTGKLLTYWDQNAVLCGSATVIAVNAPLCALNGSAVAGVSATSHATGSYITSQGNANFGDLWFSQYFGRKENPQFNFGVEWIHHLGSDPFTGGAWSDPNTIQGTLTFASRGNLTVSNSPYLPIPSNNRSGSNEVMLSWARFGLNGTGGTENVVVAPVAAGQQLGLLNPAGTNLTTVILSRWISNQFRTGLTFLHLQNNAGAGIPLGGLLAPGFTACPGCVVSRINANQLYLDSAFIF